MVRAGFLAAVGTALAVLTAVAGCSPPGGNEVGSAVNIKVARTTSWRTSEIASPAGITDAVFRGISCFNADHCVALGQAFNNSETAFAMTEVRGNWQKAVPLTTPAWARDWTVNDISCPSAQLCIVVGQLDPVTPGPSHAFAASVSGRHWSALQTIRTATALNAVSCTASGSCVAVGDDSSRPVIATRSGGRWQQAVHVSMSRVKPSGDIQNALTSVACSRPGSCVAVGSYSKLRPAGLTAQPMMVIESHGSWRPAQAIATPTDIGTSAALANAGGTGNGPVSLAGLETVSCLSRGWCMAVGRYLTGRLRWAGMAVTEVNGHVGRTQGGLPPLNAITCDSHNCLGIGSTTVNFSGGNAPYIAITYSSGHWNDAMLIKPPANANRSPQISPLMLRAVDCFAAGGCIVVGDYMDKAARSRLLVASRP
jgi:hypothetical protein